MTSYVIRRLLIMIPTFFGISLVIFLVLNLAPGRPGAQQRRDGVADQKNEGTQQSYRIFREQFNLDKPTLFNLRFRLTRQEVEDVLALAIAAPDLSSAAERLAAQDALEDWGSYAIPHLAAILRDRRHEQGSRLRDTATYFLRITARQPLVDPFAQAPSPEVLAQNRAIDRENALVASMKYDPGDSEADKQRVIQAWLDWVAKRSAQFDYSFADKVRIFSTETRFFKYWENLLSLDFGVSLTTRKPVMETLVSKLRYSLALSLTSLILAYLIAIPLGVFSAVRRDTSADRGLTVGLFMLYSLPSFFVATVLLYGLSLGSDWHALRLFPTGGWQSENYSDLTTLGQLGDVLWHLILPLFCMTYGSLAAISRYMRTGLLEVIQSDYVRTARAKGLPERQVIGKHALKNGLLPILTLLAGLLPAVLGGSVIIEYIFGIPGMGLWVIDAIYQRDYNVIMAVQLLSTVLVLVGLLLTDISYALVDPRIRYE